MDGVEELAKPADLLPVVEAVENVDVFRRDAEFTAGRKKT